jgi:hypothetical protein
MAARILPPKKRLPRQALRSKKTPHPKPTLAITRSSAKLQIAQIETLTDRFFPEELISYLEHSSPNLVDSFMMTRFHERANLRRRLSDTIMDLLNCECQILLACRSAQQRQRSTKKNNPTKGGSRQ